MDSWQEFVRGSGPDKDSYEYQGYAFAGFLLVPKHHLELKVKQCIPEIQAEIAAAKSAGIHRVAYLDFAVNSLSNKLAGIFDVSAEVIQKRIKNDKLDAKIP